jgi:hypothetical protein
MAELPCYNLSNEQKAFEQFLLNYPSKRHELGKDYKSYRGIIDGFNDNEKALWHEFYLSPA